MPRPSTNATMAAHQRCVNMNVAIAASAPNSNVIRMTALMVIAVPDCWSHRSTPEPFNAAVATRSMFAIGPTISFSSSVLPPAAPPSVEATGPPPTSCRRFWIAFSRCT